MAAPVLERARAQPRPAPAGLTRRSPGATTGRPELRGAVDRDRTSRAVTEVSECFEAYERALVDQRRRGHGRVVLGRSGGRALRASPRASTASRRSRRGAERPTRCPPTAGTCARRSPPTAPTSWWRPSSSPTATGPAGAASPRSGARTPDGLARRPRPRLHDRLTAWPSTPLGSGWQVHAARSGGPDLEQNGEVAVRWGRGQANVREPCRSGNVRDTAGKSPDPYVDLRVYSAASRAGSRPSAPSRAQLAYSDLKTGCCSASSPSTSVSARSGSPPWSACPGHPSARRCRASRWRAWSSGRPDGGFLPVVPDVAGMRQLYEVRVGLELQALRRPLAGWALSTTASCSRRSGPTGSS